jgi:ABC-type multidrug transport system ATPase subunit
MADISYIHKSGEKLPMHLSSSMVNQLVTVYLYFKYWVEEKDNFLLLDEPEMNLHPSKKLEITELLLKFASNNKLLIATHSSSIAKSIINYIHLFDLKERLDKTELSSFIENNDLQIDHKIELKSSDIGIYYFNGKTIVSYKQDDNPNIHFGTFTDIEKLQNKQYEYIMDKLEDES